MSSNFSSRAPWKRSACDRCRAQKLRCHRDEGQSADTCLRCLKSQAKCITSKAKPTGRPPSRQQQQQQQQQNQQQNQQQQHPTPQQQPTKVTQTDNHSSHTASSSESVGTTDMSMIGLDYDLSLDTFLDGIDMQHGDFTVATELLDSSLHHQSTPSIAPPPSLTADVSPPLQQPYQFRLPKGDPTMSVRIDDAGFLLSKLHYELSEQLYYIRSVPWDVQSALRLTFSHHHHLGNGDDTEVCESSPLAQVSSASTELEKLLAGLRLQVSTDTSSPTFGCSPTSSSSSSYRRISTTQLLTVLSCYIQIVSIYDKIFSRVLEYLTKNSRASTWFQQVPATPKIFLGGLPIPPYQTLPGSLLVHLIEHQLQPIEHLMGLPDDYRVSSKSRDSNSRSSTSSGNSTVGGDMGGLFGGQHSQSLLNAVIELGENRDGSLDSIRSIWSLKVKMQQIKDF